MEGRTRAKSCLREKTEVAHLAFGGLRRGAGLVVLHVLTLGYVALSRALVETSRAMRTLDVVARVAGGRWRQVAQLSAGRQVGLHLLRRADRVYEILVLAPPVRLGQLWVRVLIRLERLALQFKGDTSYFTFGWYLTIFEYHSLRFLQ